MASYCRSIPGRQSCPTGETRKAERNGRSLARLLRHCRVFPVAFFLARLAARSCRPRHGWRSIRIGVLIHFALTAWRAHLLPAAERQAVGVGGSARTKRTGCQSLSGHHPRPIGNVHTREAPAFAVCADNRFIASAGMSTCGTQGPTRMQPGTAHAWSRGNSGLRRVITPGFSDAAKSGAAAKAADGCGRAREIDHRIPLCRVWSECRDAPWPALLDHWGLPNLQVINRDVHAAKCAERGTDAPRAISHQNSPDRVNVRNAATPPASTNAAHRDSDRLFLSNQNDEPRAKQILFAGLPPLLSVACSIPSFNHSERTIAARKPSTGSGMKYRSAANRRCIVQRATIE